MSGPLVSVICLCYNQARFVAEAIQSVLDQTYAHVELIVVDDASTDDSVHVIREKIKDRGDVQFLSLQKNVGNCKAFNTGYRLAKGEFLIDLAADDILLPQRIAVGVEALQSAGPAYGVHFSDALWISESGETLYRHSDRFPHRTIPRGDVYREVIRRFFICSPTVMFTRRVMETLNGYDETLSYEDFDFWVRSSRTFLYDYSPEVLVKKRVVPRSLSEEQFQLRSRHQRTTFSVCEKILRLNRTPEEQRALASRIRYEILLNLKLLNFGLAFRYVKLEFENYRRKFPGLALY